MSKKKKKKKARIKKGLNPYTYIHSLFFRVAGITAVARAKGKNQ
jgi:hypothetical protein